MKIQPLDQNLKLAEEKNENCLTKYQSKLIVRWPWNASLQKQHTVVMKKKCLGGKMSAAAHNSM